MKKYYFLLLILAFLSVNLIQAQTVCPELLGNQSTTTLLHFRIDPGTCGDFPETGPDSFISVNTGGPSSTFVWSSCNGTNLKYTLDPSSPPLTDDATFVVFFPSLSGITVCGYSLGVYDPTLSNNEVSLNESVSVFPNPLLKDNQLTVKTPFNITAKLFMYDVTGKIAITDEIDNLNRKQINTSTLTNGVYFLQLVTDNATITRKVIIMK